MAGRSSSRFEVVGVQAGLEPGPKASQAELVLDARGVVGDADAGSGHRQLLLLPVERLGPTAGRGGPSLVPGELGEHLSVRGLEPRDVGLLDSLTIGAVRLEVTQVGRRRSHGHPGRRAPTPVPSEAARLLDEDAIYLRVVEGGHVAPGAGGRHEARPFRVRVVTLSDRASRAEYEDRSGPRLVELLEAHFAPTRWHLAIERSVLPDDPGALRAALVDARDAGVDVVFTTGGTGVGPRDHTPEVVLTVADRTLPGIMEHIRWRFGRDLPGARLSRSVAGVVGRTQLYALPGSPRAVEEYVGVILETLEHVARMIHAIDAH